MPSVGRVLGVLGRGAVALPMLALGVIAWAVAVVVAGAVVMARPGSNSTEPRSE